MSTSNDPGKVKKRHYFNDEIDANEFKHSGMRLEYLYISEFNSKEWDYTFQLKSKEAIISSCSLVFTRKLWECFSVVACTEN